MKTLFLATVAFCVVAFVNGAATGTTTSATSSSTSFPAPEGFHPANITGLVGPDTAIQPDITTDAARHYWACLSISPSTFHWGAARGGSKSSALRAAEKLCGKKDCNKDWLCGELGCIGLDFGSKAAWVSWASGYGKKDASKAENLAKAECKAHDVGCGKPGYFCSKYIV
jgi:hypothetical protein